MTTETPTTSAIHNIMYEKGAQSFYFPSQRSSKDCNMMMYSREEQSIIEGVRSLNMEEMSSREFFYDDDNDTKSTETKTCRQEHTLRQHSKNKHG